MKKFILLVIITSFLGCLNTFGQNTTFEYLLESDANLSVTDLNEDEYGNFYFTITSNEINKPNYKHTILGKISNLGELIDTVSFRHNSKSKVFYNVHSINQGEFILAGVEYNPDNQENISIITYLINDNLLISDSANYCFPEDQKFRYFNSYFEDGADLLISGGYFTGPSFKERHSFVMILDDELDSIGFNEFEGYLGISHFRKLNINQYWVIEEVARDISILDSSLNIIQTSDVPDFIFGNYSMKWDTDTSFYLLGYNLYPSPNYNLSLLRYTSPIDTSGYQLNIIRVSDTIDFPSERNGLDYMYKNSIFAGGTRNLDKYNPYHSHQPSWLMLFQTDSLLNLRWECFYGGDAYYVMQKLIATRDGGCLVAGTRFDYHNNNENKTDIIVLKLNSEGLLVGQNELQESLLREAIVYPNPGSTIMQVRLAVQHPEALLELFDSQGKLVLSQQLHEKESRINTAKLLPGTYIYRLSAATGLNESGKWIKQ